MNPENTAERLLSRNAILLQLESALPATLPLETLRQGIRLSGHSLSAPELAKELDYLIGKNLVESTPSLLSQAHLRYHLTPAGRDYLESQGLA